MKRSGLFLALMITSVGMSYAQLSGNEIGYFEDAARFSFTNFGGTARTQGMAGVQTALGADISSATVNPAGLGLYNRSEMSLTPSIQFGNAETTYSSPSDNSTQRNKRANFNIANFGLVFSSASPEETEKPNKGGAFAISYNRINNFQGKTGFSGENTANSMRNYFLEQMNGNPESTYANQISDFDGIINVEGLAYFAWLANNSSNTTYTTFDDGAPVSQRETATTTGAQYQWDFSYGTNINDKIYLGLGIGVQRSSYTSNKTYSEDNLDANPPEGFESFRLSQEFRIRATGVNFKAGVIARPTNFMRVGFSFLSPTFHTVKESSFSVLEAIFNSNVVGPVDLVQNYSTLNVEYDYNMTTPYRLNAGIALFAGKQGFVSLDGEYVAFNTTELSNKQSNEFDNFGLFDEDNEAIINNFKNVVNLRLGGELRADIYRVRAGFAYYTHPLAGIDDINRNRTFITLGGGIKLPSYYLDIALIRSGSKSTYSPYTLASGNAPTTNTKASNVNFMFSWGTYF